MHAGRQQGAWAASTATAWAVRPSLGMPSVDLTTAQGRLRPGWLHDLLMDPAKVTPATRMPAFWYGGSVSFPNLAGGTADSQIGRDLDLPRSASAICLSAGPCAPTGGKPVFELIPVDEPIVHRTMMQNARQPLGARRLPRRAARRVRRRRGAPRQGLARQVLRCGRLVERSGRQPHGPRRCKDVIDMPSGPSFAVLDSPGAAWPKSDKTRNLGGKFKGYMLDKTKTPIFRYDLSGVKIQEKDAPGVEAGGDALVRTFRLDAQQAPNGLDVSHAASGQKIEAGQGEGNVDGG